MPLKKIRGLKRKTINMVRRIEEETENFPSDFYNGYWHLHLPVAQDFIGSNNTPFSIKKLCVQTLINRAKHLIDIKPNTNEYRVVVFTDFFSLFDSQIIVFYGDSHFRGFFDRNDKFQKWIPSAEEKGCLNQWGIKVPDKMKTLKFKEEILDVDEQLYTRDIWFIGELD